MIIFILEVRLINVFIIGNFVVMIELNVINSIINVIIILISLELLFIFVDVIFVLVNFVCILWLLCKFFKWFLILFLELFFKDVWLMLYVIFVNVVVLFLLICLFL